MIHKIRSILRLMGIDPAMTIRFLWNLPRYLMEYRQLKQELESKGRHDFPFGYFLPILEDRYEQSGVMSGHYFHQDLLVARRIFESRPVKHVDIGSRQDGFVAHVATFREIEIVDIRPQTGHVRNIQFRQADLMRLPEDMIEYCDSLSCLHAVEHFGLGRYGDPIDALGHEKALDNMYRILKRGGRFYFGTPIGPQRIEFNAHRVFSLSYLLSLFEDKYVLERFSYVDDKGDLHENVELTEDFIQRNCGCRFGCGIFELFKK